mmetsp:Transcript_55087/g.156182  ORF Transcript_55087/g.156182 Transcript_55087/m.156182 type:complete len:221 (-) Transcript_55087:522-1184(-)
MSSPSGATGSFRALPSHSGILDGAMSLRGARCLLKDLQIFRDPVGLPENAMELRRPSILTASVINCIFCMPPTAMELRRPSILSFWRVKPARKCSFRRRRSAMVERATAHSADCCSPPEAPQDSGRRSTTKEPLQMTKNSLPINPQVATTVPAGTCRRAATAAMAENLSEPAGNNARRFAFFLTTFRTNSSSSALMGTTGTFMVFCLRKPSPPFSKLASA